MKRFIKYPFALALLGASSMVSDTNAFRYVWLKSFLMTRDGLKILSISNDSQREYSDIRPRSVEIRKIARHLK